jgi:hypothetical protein
MSRKRSDKVAKRKKRQTTRRAEKVRAQARREEEEAAEDAEDMAALEPLGALFSDRAPLASIRFDLSELPEEAPAGGKGLAALVDWFLPRMALLAHEEWRERTKAAFAKLAAELKEGGATEGHPDRVALSDADFWLTDDVASGAPALVNILYRRVFEWTCGSAAAAGKLPAWATRALGLSQAEAKRDLLDKRRDRVGTRLGIGPFTDDLTLDDMPSAASMISGPATPPAEFAGKTTEHAARDLTPERRAAIARRLRDAADREDGQGRPLYAFDLRTLAAALESDDILDQGLARLYYSRSVYYRREAATASGSEWPMDAP